MQAATLMADLSTMTGDGGTIELGGRKFLMRRLKVGDWGKIRAWLKERVPRPFQVVDEALRDLQPLKEADPESFEKVRAELMMAALGDAQRGAVTSDESLVQEIMNSPEGVAYLLWLSIRGEHPGTTYEEVLRLLEDTDMATVKQRMDNANGLDPNDEAVLFGNPTQQAKKPV